MVAPFKVGQSPLNAQRKTILRRHKTKRREAPKVSKCEPPILGIQLFIIPTHGVFIFAKLDNVVYLSKLPISVATFRVRNFNLLQRLNSAIENSQPWVFNNFPYRETECTLLPNSKMIMHPKFVLLCLKLIFCVQKMKWRNLLQKLHRNSIAIFPSYHREVSLQIYPHFFDIEFVR